MAKDKSASSRRTEDTEQEKYKDENAPVTEHPEEKEADSASAEETGQKQEIEEIEKELSDYKNRYLRLYADFENYKKVVAKEKEDLIKYSSEESMKELLSVIDHMELALQHSPRNDASKALTEGVEMTLKEFKSILEKFGLFTIEAVGKPFDPHVHHAMSQIVSEENDENTVIAEFRKGYMLKDRVLRASLVGVSKKPSQEINTDPEEDE